MPIPARDYFDFLFNNGRGLRTDQIDGANVESVTENEATGIVTITSTLANGTSMTHQLDGSLLINAAPDANPQPTADNSNFSDRRLWWDGVTLKRVTRIPGHGIIVDWPDYASSSYRGEFRDNPPNFQNNQFYYHLGARSFVYRINGRNIGGTPSGWRGHVANEAAAEALVTANNQIFEWNDNVHISENYQAPVNAEFFWEPALVATYELRQSEAEDTDSEVQGTVSGERLSQAVASYGPEEFRDAIRYGLVVIQDRSPVEADYANNRIFFDGIVARKVIRMPVPGHDRIVAFREDNLQLSLYGAGIYVDRNAADTVPGTPNVGERYFNRNHNQWEIWEAGNYWNTSQFIAAPRDADGSLWIGEFGNEDLATAHVDRVGEVASYPDDSGIYVLHVVDSITAQTEDGFRYELDPIFNAHALANAEIDNANSDVQGTVSGRGLARVSPQSDWDETDSDENSYIQNTQQAKAQLADIPNLDRKTGDLIVHTNRTWANATDAQVTGFAGRPATLADIIGETYHNSLTQGVAEDYIVVRIPLANDLRDYRVNQIDAGYAHNWQHLELIDEDSTYQYGGTTVHIVGGSTIRAQFSSEQVHTEYRGDTSPEWDDVTEKDEARPSREQILAGTDVEPRPWSVSDVEEIIGLHGGDPAGPYGYGINESSTNVDSLDLPVIGEIFQAGDRPIHIESVRVPVHPTQVDSASNLAIELYLVRLTRNANNDYAVNESALLLYNQVNQTHSVAPAGERTLVFGQPFPGSSTLTAHRFELNPDEYFAVLTRHTEGYAVGTYSENSITETTDEQPDAIDAIAKADAADEAGFAIGENIWHSNGFHTTVEINFTYLDAQTRVKAFAREGSTELPNASDIVDGPTDGEFVQVDSNNRLVAHHIRNIALQTTSSDVVGSNISGFIDTHLGNDNWRNRAPFFPITLANVGGTADAITVTTGRSLSALINGMLVAFVTGFANTGAVTVNVDGQGAIDVRTINNRALVTGDVLLNEPLMLWYSADAAVFFIVPIWLGNAARRDVGDDDGNVVVLGPNGLIPVPYLPPEFVPASSDLTYQINWNEQGNITGIGTHRWWGNAYQANSPIVIHKFRVPVNPPSFGGAVYRARAMRLRRVGVDEATASYFLATGTEVIDGRIRHSGGYHSSVDVAGVANFVEGQIPGGLAMGASEYFGLLLLIDQSSTFVGGDADGYHGENSHIHHSNYPYNPMEIVALLTHGSGSDPSESDDITENRVGSLAMQVEYSAAAGSQFRVDKDGALVYAGVGRLNFTGGGVTVTDSDDYATVDIPSVDEQAQGLTLVGNHSQVILWQYFNQSQVPPDPPDVYNSTNETFLADLGDWHTSESDALAVRADPTDALWVAYGGTDIDSNGNPVNRTWTVVSATQIRYSPDRVDTTTSEETDSRYIQFRLPSGDWSPWIAIAADNDGWVNVWSELEAFAAGNVDIYRNFELASSFDSEHFSEIRFRAIAYGTRDADGNIDNVGAQDDHIMSRKDGGQWTEIFTRTNNNLQSGSFKLRLDDITGLDVVQSGGTFINTEFDDNIHAITNYPERRHSFSVQLVAESETDLHTLVDLRAGHWQSAWAKVLLAVDFK